nr:hypothetical protein [Streptomyces sp. 846.5]
MPTPEDPQDAAPDVADPFEGLVLDADFIKGAQHQEGSARARMLADKWKKHPPTDTAFRSAPTPRRRRRLKLAGNWQLPLFVVLAVALVLVGMNSGAVADWFSKHLGGKASGSAAAADAQPSTSTAPAIVADPVIPTVAHPFADSPAESWPTGVAGIVLPSTHGVGAFSSAEVATDLATTRTFLTTAYLDPKILAGGPTEPVAALLQHDQATWFRAAVAHPSKQTDPVSWVSRFKPGYAVLATDAVRTKGTLTFKGDGHNGLLVHADFIFVYALRPAGATGVTGNSPVERTIAHHVLDFDFYDPARYDVKAGSLSIASSEGRSSNSMCGVYNGYLNPTFNTLHADTSAAPTASGAPSGPAYDPYAGSGDINNKIHCGLASRN